MARSGDLVVVDNIYLNQVHRSSRLGKKYATVHALWEIFRLPKWFSRRTLKSSLSLDKYTLSRKRYTGLCTQDEALQRVVLKPRFPTNLYLESALQLTNQSAISIFSPIKYTRTHFPMSAPCAALRPLVRCLSHLAVPSSHFYISVLATVNAQFLSSKHLYFLSLRAQPILKTTGHQFS